MGKNKTEEVSSVARTAEASTRKQENQQQAEAPKKRGRPRKITVAEKAEAEQVEKGKQEQTGEDNKRTKVTEEDEGAPKGTAASMAVTEEGDSAKESSKGRARRKSKPHKSR
ncbi:hypothetical protein Dimus_002329 [Dionaea muscipula]